MPGLPHPARDGHDNPAATTDGPAPPAAIREPRMSRRLRRLAPAPVPLLLLADHDAGFFAMARDALQESAAVVELRPARTGPELLAQLDGHELGVPALVVASSELPGAP